MTSEKIITILDKQYEIVKELGTGVTAVVHLGLEMPAGVQVAIKKVRLNLPPDKLREFNAEWDDLRNLYDELESAGYVGYVPEPIVFERDHYIVQSLAGGRPLLDLLDNKASLPELEAVEISRQLGRVLHILHTKLKKSYRDFQLKNVFWQPSASGEEGQITVIDWNHLGSGDRFEPEADILKLGNYFCRMLTGVSLEKQAVPDWFSPLLPTVSEGCKFIVEKALRLGEDHYEAVADMLQDLDEIKSLYTQDFDTLAQEVKEIPESPDKDALDQKLLIKADIFERRLQRRHEERRDQEYPVLKCLTTPQRKQSVTAAAMNNQSAVPTTARNDKVLTPEEFLDSDPDLLAGWERLEVREVSGAIEQFKAVAQKRNSLPAQRMVLIGRAVEAIDYRIDDVRESLIEILSALHLQNFSIVPDLVAGMQPEQRPYFQFLADEAKVCTVFGQSDESLSRADRQRRYDEAIDSLEELYSRPDYQTALFSQYGWSRETIAERQRELQQAKEQEKIKQQDINDIEKAKETGFVPFRNRLLRKLPTSPARQELLRLGLDECFRQMALGYPGDAQKLIEDILNSSDIPLPDEMKAELQIAQTVAAQLVEIQTKLKQLRPDRFVDWQETYPHLQRLSDELLVRPAHKREIAQSLSKIIQNFLADPRSVSDGVYIVEDVKQWIETFEIHLDVGQELNTKIYEFRKKIFGDAYNISVKAKSPQLINGIEYHLKNAEFADSFLIQNQGVKDPTWQQIKSGIEKRIEELKNTNLIWEQYLVAREKKDWIQALEQLTKLKAMGISGENKPGEISGWIGETRNKARDSIQEEGKEIWRQLISAGSTDDMKNCFSDYERVKAAIDQFNSMDNSKPVRFPQNNSLQADELRNLSAAYMDREKLLKQMEQITSLLSAKQFEFEAGTLYQKRDMVDDFLGNLSANRPAQKLKSLLDEKLAEKSRQAIAGLEVFLRYWLSVTGGNDKFKFYLAEWVKNLNTYDRHSQAIYQKMTENLKTYPPPQA